MKAEFWIFVAGNGGVGWSGVGELNILRGVGALQAKTKVDRCIQKEDSLEEKTVFFLFSFLFKESYA